MLHLFFGEDVYSLNLALERLRQDGGFDPVDVIHIDAREKPPQEVIMTVGTPGLFASKRLIILGGFGETARRGKKSGEKAATEEQGLTLESLIDSAPDSTTVVVVAQGIRGDSSIVREARQIGTKRGKVDMREFRAPRQKDMPRWIVQCAAEQGIRLEPGAAQQLALRVGENVSIAGVELQKLKAGADPGSVVTTDLVEDLVPKSAEESVFPLIDAIATRRSGPALELLERQLNQVGGSESELALRLLRLVARQFRILLQIKLMLAEKRKRSEVISQLKLPEYYADRYFGQAKRLSATELSQGLEHLAATEQAIKNGEAGEAHLHLLLMELTNGRGQQPASAVSGSSGEMDRTPAVD